MIIGVVIGVSQSPSIADVKYASLLLAPTSVSEGERHDLTNSGIAQAFKSEHGLNGTNFFVM
jgi:hypothetical protein